MENTNFKIIIFAVFALMLIACIDEKESEPEQKFNSVKIGNQIWMTENLNVENFRNGEPIPQAKTEDEWRNAGHARRPAWCYYENDFSNGAKYGKLYNWYAVDDLRGLAPEGWQIPTNEDWTQLINYLGGNKLAGTKMKSTSGLTILQMTQ